MTTTQKTATWQRNTSKLTSYKPTWNNGTTRTIRVPVALADQTLKHARALDEGLEISVGAVGNDSTTSDNLRDAIDHILTKIDEKLPGYKSNSASQLIKDLRALGTPKP
jgi:hypothetical protein